MAHSKAFGTGLADAEGLSDQMVLDQDDEDDVEPSKRKVKAKKFLGLLEWVME